MQNVRQLQSKWHYAAQCWYFKVERLAEIYAAAEISYWPYNIFTDLNL